MCKQKSEEIELQFDEYISQLQQSKESILGELSTRLRKELAKLQNTIDTLDRQESELDKIIQEITDLMKCDKLKLLKVHGFTYVFPTYSINKHVKIVCSLAFYSIAE